MMKLIFVGLAAFLAPLAPPPSPFSPLIALSFCPFLYVLVLQKKWTAAAATGLFFGVGIVGHTYFWINSFIPWAGSWVVVFWVVITLYHSLIISLFSLAVFGIKKRAGIDAALLAAPLLWTLTEYAASFGILGIPESIGHSQILNPLFRRGAPLLGVNYLSFLTLSAASFLVMIFYHRKTYRRCVLLMVFFLVLLAANQAVDKFQHRSPGGGSIAEFQALLVQPPIDPNLLNDPSKGQEVFNTFLAETQMALASSPVVPDLIIWPEMVFPFVLNRPGPTRNRLFASLDQAGYRSEILVGGPSEEPGPTYFNTAMLFKNGEAKDLYEKEKLFPIGEYVPLRSMLSFIKQYLPLKLRLANYSSGEEIQPLDFSKGKIGISICLESLFTDLIRRRVVEGAEILLNLTNDAWFAGSFAESGHFYFGAMRALENARPFLQSSSVGVNGMVDAEGRVVAMRDSSRPGSLLVTVRPQRNLTLYTRLGPWRFALFFLLTALYYLVYFGPRRRFSS